MIVTTCCYIFRDDEVLLLHRIKKENDINASKWIGVGGKVEVNESPADCIIREVKEETGLTITSVKLKGIITFPNMYHGEDELMFLYTTDQFVGQLVEDCDEGELKWIHLSKVKDLNMWEGDYHFFEWFKDNKIHEALIHYENDRIIKYMEY